MVLAKLRTIRGELIGGLTLVILVSSLTTYGILLFASRSNFDTLVRANDLTFAREIASSLEQFYGSEGSWKNLASFLRDNEPESDFVQSADDHKHPVHGGMPVIVTDARGVPIYSGFDPRDSNDELPDHLKTDSAVAVVSDGRTVAYVFVKSMISLSYNPQEKEYFLSLTRNLGLSLLIGMLLTVVMASLLAARFSRPIKELEGGAGSIAGGKLDTRVRVQGAAEIRGLAQSFNRMADQLQQGEEARQNLLADIAHELRTPVSIIQANLEMIFEGVYKADEEKLRSLYKETNLLSSLISDLRSLSDLEVGMAGMRRDVVNLTSLIHESCEKLAPRFLEKNIDMKVNVEEDIVIKGDEEKVSQVLANLLTNALKYGDSFIGIQSEKIVVRDSSFVRISVSDNGPGVPEDSLGKLFDRFYRVDSSRSRSSGGRGLGLAISRKIIEMSGGSMGARNREEGGLTVWFDLPL